MTNQSTIDKLIEMRLSSMADAFRNQLNDSKMKDVPFEDRLGAYFGRIRTLIPATSGQHFGIIRTA